MLSINDFKFANLIGKGSYGSVYKATKIDDNTTYAIKKIKIDKLNHCEKKYIINEIKILASHNSDNLLTYFGVFHNDYSIYIVTEYLVNGDLYQLIKKHKTNNTTFITNEIWKYFIGICLGLQHLHKNNIIHRDIKCANILIDNNNNIKLADFGIIKIMPTYMNYAQTQIGTPYYMAPEIYKNHRYCEKCDIWSLGCVLYEMIFLIPPFTAKNIHDLKYKIMNGRYSPISTNNTQLKLLLKSLLVTNPYQRPCITTILSNPNIVSYLHNYTKPGSFNPLFNEHFAIPQRIYDWKFLINQFTKYNRFPINKTELPDITFSKKPSNKQNEKTQLKPTPPRAPPQRQPTRSRVSVANKLSKKEQIKIPEPPKEPPKEPLNNPNKRPLPYLKSQLENKIDKPIISNTINKELLQIDKQISELKEYIDIERKKLEIKMCQLKHLEKKRKISLEKNYSYIEDKNLNNNKRDIHTPASNIKNSLVDAYINNYTPRSSLLIKIGSRHESNHFLS